MCLSALPHTGFPGLDGIANIKAVKKAQELAAELGYRQDPEFPTNSQLHTETFARSESSSRFYPPEGLGTSSWMLKKGMFHLVMLNLHGYSKEGNALYQIHLVKSSTARAFIPKEFRLVEAFGYTLGGFFLASYDDSPAGVFDELVMIAGIVWNPPTSCAWAARVLVNSNEACHHGRKKITAVPKRQRERAFGFLDTFGLGTTLSHPQDLMEVKVSEVDNSAASANICNIQIRSDESETKLGKWMGPTIRMSLPSFSGNTKYNPNLLKYSCHIHCR
ncbi:unnamed protein product [Eruca vesicaria subsp. sativa]|uniref:Protein NEOXANTHIN-DEFICIENT 1 n=1 Tax=Eruca vesicaria subsp. sativa TaxID=29727 RepID=A0ABC8IV87_ERUVS|nr:unnamed protein product [Eruca vesicaria subsp. sativa]